MRLFLNVKTAGNSLFMSQNPFIGIIFAYYIHQKDKRIMKISTRKYVAVTYDLNVGEEGEQDLMERATVENPLQFIYGIGMMIPAFEKALSGLEVGAEFDFTIPAADAYGEYQEDHVIELPKDIFVVDGKFDSEAIKEGETVPMMDNEGNRMMGSVLEVREEVVVMDFNHPLAGETLHFTGKVIDVHEPTAEEIAALTAPAGGCGCGDCEGGDCGDHGHNDGCGCGGCH